MIPFSQINVHINNNRFGYKFSGGFTSFIFWIKGISIIGSNRSGIFLHLMPIFSTLMAIIIFKEKFMNFHFIGAVFIITGIVLSSKGRMP